MTHFSVIWGLSVCGLSAQQDDFNDGTLEGWTLYDPISQQLGGSFATMTAENGGIRIAASVSPNPLLGPGRGAAMRQDVVYQGDFYLSVDVTGFASGGEQAIGFLALVPAAPSIGDTDGYAFTFHPVDNDIQISRVENEAPIEISDAVALTEPMDPAKSYRLVFWGSGGEMEGRMYDLDDLTTPLAVTTGTDSTHTAGTCGLVVFDNSPDGNNSADASFDNYVANDGTLPDLELVVDGDGEYRVQYPDWLVNATLRTSPNLEPGSWTEVPLSQLLRANGKFFRLDDFSVAPTAYFHLIRSTN